MSKFTHILLIAAFICLATPIVAQTTTSYARSGMKTTLEIQWSAYNRGTIQWQESSDNGSSWKDITGQNKPTLEVTPSSDKYYRAKIDSQTECTPVYITRILKMVNFAVSLESQTSTTAEFLFTNVDLNDAQIIEYGFCYNLSAMNTRNFTEMPLCKVGTTPPAGESFTAICKDLAPGTTYSIRAYFKTADGSVIYGPGRIATTLAGPKWSTENWTITPTSIAAYFEIAGTVDSQPSIVFKFGSSIDQLTQKEISSLPNYKYNSETITGLSPNTTYYAQVELTMDGEKQILQKEIKTLPDYTGTIVDDSPASVKHTIRWDATKTLHRISPEGLMTEYPRIIRLNKDTLLCSYHGGSGNDHWVNIYLQKSYDNGQTWTDPAIIMDKERSNLGKGYWRFCNPEMTRLQNGWILMSFVGNGNPETNDNCHVMIIISKDGGQTWGDPSIIGRGRTWEPMIVQLPHGELELFVASEAAWFPGANLSQEILYCRSTDNGLTWTALERACYSPNRRDGMPVGLVMQGNKGIMFTIEIVNDGGFGSPSVVRRALDQEWDPTPWNGTNYERRWRTNIDAHGGAPYMIQLPTGEIVISAHVNGRNGIWQTSYPRILVGDSNGKNFITPVTPITNLPASQGIYYNSLFLKDNETVWLVVTNSLYEGSTRKKGEIKYLEGKIIERSTY